MCAISVFPDYVHGLSKDLTETSLRLDCRPSFHMPTNEQVVNEHIQALIARDFDTLVDGYAQDAVIIMGSTCVAGRRWCWFRDEHVAREPDLG